MLQLAQYLEDQEVEPWKRKWKKSFPQKDKGTYVALVESKEVLDNSYNEWNFQSVHLFEMKSWPLYKCSIFKS